MRNLLEWLNSHSHLNWALADQVLVSGSGFLTGVLLARVLGLDGYGRFALLYAILLYANTIQNAAVISPMMSILPKLVQRQNRQKYVGGVIAVQLVLSLVSALAVGAVVAAYQSVRVGGQIDATLSGLVVLVLFFQLQDWLRRYYYSNMRSGAVFMTDLVSYGGQLVLLGGLALFDELSVSRSLWAIGLTSGMAFGLGWFVERFRPDFGLVRNTLGRHFSLGRDLLISGQIQWAGSQGLLMLAGSFLGADAAGGIRAAQNILGPTNVINNVVMNVVPVQAAQRYQSGGARDLIRYLKSTGSVLAGGAFVFGILISIGAAALMSWLYGLDYLVYAPLVVWGAGYWFLSIIYMQFLIYHRTAESSRHLIPASMLFSAASIIITVVIIGTLRESALFVAAIIGQLLMIAYLWLIVGKGDGKK